MYNQVIFYNHFGAGDIFESREFAKAWMKLVPANAYFYSHGKSPRILLDIPELQFKEVTIHMKPMLDVLDDSNGNLYINMWIGRNSRYVLPGIGCTVEKLFEMHNDILAVKGLGTLPGQPVDYIPNIDYTKFDLKDAKKFLKAHKEEKIYIDNGVVQSNQAVNFPFSEIIDNVSNDHKDKCFITTQDSGLSKPNVYPLADVIGSRGWGFDLNEASYVSRFCTTLIGRNSGPHVFTQVKDNCMDGEKKLLSFTYGQQGSSFVVNSDVPIKKYWSPETEIGAVTNRIVEVIG